jgi:hypothetical protein
MTATETPRRVVALSPSCHDVERAPVAGAAGH